MAVISLALVLAFICVIREIQTLFIYLRWHRKDVYVSEVGELIHTETHGKHKSRYMFLFYIGTGEDRIKTTYEETASDPAHVKRPTGYRTEVYYDPERPKNDRYRFRTVILHDLKANAILFLICAAVILAGILFTDLQAYFK